MLTSAPDIPVNTVAPVLTGAQVGGAALSVTDGTWTGEPAPTFTYAWFKVVVGGDQSIAIDTATWNPGGGYANADIYCVVTATNSSGSVSATSNTVTVQPAA